jgi:hypothetical protein
MATTSRITPLLKLESILYVPGAAQNFSAGNLFSDERGGGASTIPTVALPQDR